MLERAGQITLPPISYVRHNSLGTSRTARTGADRSHSHRRPVAQPGNRSRSSKCDEPRRKPLFNSLMEEHHYLAMSSRGRAPQISCMERWSSIACLAWSSAPRHIGSRDRYIGWDAEARRSRIRFIVYNTRFLILPWVRVEHLAPHILGRMASRISADWQQMYEHPLYFLETFVDRSVFAVHVIKRLTGADGRTTGRGKQSNSYVTEPSIKEVLAIR